VLIVIVMIIVPVLLGFPAVFFSIPPLMVLIPATLPFRIQIPPPLFGFVAMLAIFLDRPVVSRFRFFDRVLTLASVIRTRLRCCHKKPQCARYYECHCCLC
jgi:hypothetical protein